MNRDGILIHLLTSKTKYSSSREFCILKESCRRGGCLNRWYGIPSLEEEIWGKNSLSQDQSLLVLPRVGGEHVRVCLAGGSSWGRFCKGRTKRILEFSGHWERDIPIGENSRCTVSSNGTLIWEWSC